MAVLTACGDTDERRLRRTVGELQDLLRKEPGESRLISATQARALTEFLAPGFVLRLGAYGGEVRDDPNAVARMAAGYRLGSRSISAQLNVEELRLDPRLGEATMALAATLSADRGGGPARQTFLARVLWKKVAGDWRILELELLPAG